MFFDTRGDLFIGGPDGVAVFNPQGASAAYSTGPGSSPVVSYNAMNNQFALYLIGFNDPLGLGISPLIYAAASFAAPAAATTNWTGAAGGNWSDAAKWDQPAAPNGIDQGATLGASAGPQILVLDVPVTLGTLTLAGSAKYLVSGSNPLTMQTSSAIAAIDATLGSHEIAAPIVMASDTDVTVANAADTLTFSGGISGAATLSKEGSGTLAITGPTTYTGNTAVNRGTLRFALAAGTAVIGSTAVVTVAPGATLELAGAVSALGAAGGQRARIINDSAADGLIVSAGDQVVGDIDGAGTTTVEAGSELTADHIVQAALAIGGNATSSAEVTIAPSSASAFVLLDSPTSPPPIMEIDSPAALATALAGSGDAGAGIQSRLEVSPAADPAALSVPEPTSLALLALGAALIGLLAGCQAGGRCRGNCESDSAAIRKFERA